MMHRGTILIWLLILLAGCGGASAPPPGGAPQVEAIIIPPNDMRGGSEAVWRVNINGFNGPFSISWDFGGGAVVNEHSFRNELSPNLLKAEMINNGIESKQYKVTVSVTDKVGASDTSTFQYIVGPAGNRPPVIGNVQLNGDELSVSATDPDGDAITVSVSDEFGNSLGSSTGNSTSFAVNPWIGFWLARDIELSITASDGEDSDSASTSYTPMQLEPADDTLYAVALSGQGRAVRDPLTAGQGSGVRVVVVTGVPQRAFQFMKGVGITCEDGSDYVRGSFDAGVPDGVPDVSEVDVIDGIWALMEPDSLLIPPDDFIGGDKRMQVEEGIGRLDFNITPIGGQDLSDASGVLFSFELGFSEPGVYHIGFQAASNVSRTYYQDGNATDEYFWGDISNEGVPATIIVE